MAKVKPFHIMSLRRFCFMSYRLSRLLGATLFLLAIFPIPFPQAAKPLQCRADLSA